MTNEPSPFVFFQVCPEIANCAISFYSKIANNSHIWPRTDDQIRTLAASGALFGARGCDSRQFAALCYATLNQVEHEIGGLVVASELQGLGIGGTLIRIAVAYVIATSRPWNYGQHIIAHVHEENDQPRRLMAQIGFEYKGQVALQGNTAPLSMKRNSEGNVVGDKYIFPRTSTRLLLRWFETDFRSSLKDRTTPALIDRTLGGIQGLLEALRQEVSKIPR